MRRSLGFVVAVGLVLLVAFAASDRRRDIERGETRSTTRRVKRATMYSQRHMEAGHDT
jgi:hypothetical protein